MPNKSSEVPSTTANVNVALVGCGYWGVNLARNLVALGSLVAVSDADDKAAEKLADSTGVRALSFDEVLADPGISAVFIATPPDTHAQLAQKTMLAGKDVFVEKPLALRVSDAQELVAEAERLDRILMVGHLLRYHPAFGELESLVRSGAVGKVRYVYSNRLNFGKIRKVENILWSFSPHDLSMILSLIGTEPDRVTAIGAAYLQQGINDVTTTHLSFPDGEAAHVYVSWLHPYKEQKLVVIGDEGMAAFDDTQPWDSKLVFYPHEVEWSGDIPEAFKADGRKVPVPQEEPLTNECKHFLECVKTRARPLTDGAEAIRVLRVLEAAEESMEKSLGGNALGGGDRLRTLPGGAEVHESAVIDSDVELGAGTKVWHFSHILSGSRIGQNCTLGQNVMVGPNVSVGDGCKIQNNVSLYEGVELEEEVFCGPSAVFTNVKTPRSSIDRRGEFARTKVRRGVTIGANATIVCGHELGANSMVAAGAVVTRDVRPHELVAGVPAKQIGWVSHAGERLGTDLTCPRTGMRYRETPVGLELLDE